VTGLFLALVKAHWENINRKTKKSILELKYQDFFIPQSKARKGLSQEFYRRVGWLNIDYFFTAKKFIREQLESSFHFL